MFFFSKKSIWNLKYFGLQSNIFFRISLWDLLFWTSSLWTRKKCPPFTFDNLIPPIYCTSPIPVPSPLTQRPTTFLDNHQEGNKKLSMLVIQHEIVVREGETARIPCDLSYSIKRCVRIQQTFTSQVNKTDKKVSYLRHFGCQLSDSEIRHQVPPASPLAAVLPLFHYCIIKTI